MSGMFVASPCSFRRARFRGPELAASPRGDYRTEGPRGAELGDVDVTGAADAEVAAVERVLASAEAVGALDLDVLSDAQLEAHLARLRRPLAMLEAARARALAEVERRVRRTADPGRVTGEVLESRRRAAKDQRMSPSDAKRAAEAGSQAAANPRMGEAFGAGDIGPRHVTLIGDALDRLPSDQRPEAERELLELARRSDAVAFGRQVREWLARQAPRQLHRQEQDNHRQRRFSMADTADGGVAFSGLAYGTAAELARTALAAFRRPDSPDEHRSPEQRSADAFEQLCDAALRLGVAPTVHGERPQVIVVVEESELGREAGVGRFAGSGQPVTLEEVGTLLTDCAVSRVVRSADGIPIEVTRNVRTVPQGLWRALVVRDGGCRWQGCDAPASWCDVAHGQHPFRAEGRLSPANAVLLCRRHHRRFDKGPWRLEIVGDQVTFHRVERPYIHPLDRGTDPPSADAPPDGAASPPDAAPRAGPGDTPRAAPGDPARAAPGDAPRAGPGDADRVGEGDTPRAGPDETTRAGPDDRPRAGPREAARAGPGDAVGGEQLEFDDSG